MRVRRWKASRARTCSRLGRAASSWPSTRWGSALSRQSLQYARMSPRRAKAVVDRVGDDPATALRELLIDAVDRLLAQGSITAITTRDIARAAGVSDGV